MLQIGDVSESIDTRRIVAEFREYFFVSRLRRLEFPVYQLVRRKAADHYCAVLAKDRQRTFEIHGTRRGRGFDHADGAAREGHNRSAGVLGLNALGERRA